MGLNYNFILDDSTTRRKDLLSTKVGCTWSVLALKIASYLDIQHLSRMNCLKQRDDIVFDSHPAACENST